MDHETDDEARLELLAYCRGELERMRAVLRAEPGGHAAGHLVRVERALHWLASGYYGRCGICGRSLDSATLRRSPERMICGACSQRPHPEQSVLTAAPW
jgi:RNA polymerase-binding transcription factor DksA